ncbi:hypothetical protein [uncultured Litoreibacter sp.]|uniref:hypothetical protein n=1 Tax=uncultured Litoreibacter sp. TaxID=1392394 RepID=UPI002636DC2B|nr:hypothetical protein [uncultured Litoreibacter sp.]
MAVKYYAQIDFDLFSDPKFRALSSNDVRFIYLTAQCSKLSNYIGLFRYPVEIWSYDANVKPIEIQAAITELQRCELIEYDHDHQALRLIGWFHSLNAPDNGNQMKGHMKSFQGLPAWPAEMFCRAIAEFTVSSFMQTLNWEDLSTEHKKAHSAFRAFLKMIFFKYGDGFNAILMDEINSRGKGAYSSIQACYQMLPSDGLQTVEPFRKGSETVSKQESKADDIKSNHKTLNPNASRKVISHSRPTASVLNSAIAKEARGVKS